MKRVTRRGHDRVVRLHRKAEHAPYNGLTPAGQDIGPAVPLAGKAVASGDVEAVYRLLAESYATSLAGACARSARSLPTLTADLFGGASTRQLICAAFAYGRSESRPK